MKSLKGVTGIVAPLDQANVDTDQIVPKQFLKLTSRTGFDKYLFHDWRYDSEGRLRPEFVLNQPRYIRAEILLTRENFGIGSSREHAVWALLDYGFKVVIAPSFADIFFNNCFKSGLAAITLPSDQVDRLFEEAYTVEEYVLKVDLEACSITKPDGSIITFIMDQFKRRLLLEGLDEIALTLRHEEKIRAYEKESKIARL